MRRQGRSGSCCLASVGLLAQADNHSQSTNPVELFTCSYKGNNDRNDLDRVIAKYNKWADKHDQTYTAWVLTPNFVNANVTMDLGWIGAWEDGNAMGAGLDTWHENGLQSEFDKVISCDTHIAAASLNIKAPSAPSGDGVVSFSNCSVGEDATPESLVGAHTAISEYMGGKGSSAGVWLFFPNWGSGKMDFDYYRVISHENYTEAGKSNEIYNNGGGWMKAMELFDGITECDGGRVYSADLVRSAAAN